MLCSNKISTRKEHFNYPAFYLIKFVQQFFFFCAREQRIFHSLLLSSKVYRHYVRGMLRICKNGADKIQLQRVSASEAIDIAKRTSSQSSRTIIVRRAGSLPSFILQAGVMAAFNVPGKILRGGDEDDMRRRRRHNGLDNAR